MKFVLCSPIHSNLTQLFFERIVLYFIHLLFWGFNLCDKSVCPAPRYFFYDKYAQCQFVSKKFTVKKNQYLSI